MDPEKKELLLESLDEINDSIKKLNRWIYEKDKAGYKTNKHTRNFYGEFKPIIKSMYQTIVILALCLEEDLYEERK